MKINWFSPLPPAKTGIALYTQALLPALGKRVAPVLWTDQAEYDRGLARQFPVREFDPLRPPWRELNRADINIYNIGNNILHKGIWQISRQHAGVVILHDVCLQNFFAELYLNQWRDPEGYRQVMRRYYGKRGLAAAVETFENRNSTIDQLSMSFPLTPLAFENSLCAITHNRANQRLLAFDPPLPAFYLDLPCSPEALHWRPETVTKGRAAPPFQLIAFGIMGPNRRLEPFLEAWRALPERAAFRFLIAGEIWDRDYVQTRIREYGLADLAQIGGYLTDEDLRAELLQSDLAVNLRYPTMGEASLSQLLIWEHALPALVTQVGWYATLPQDSVAFVRPDHEIEDIRSHLRRLLKEPERFAEMGRRGRETLERNHAPEHYVESLLHLIGEPSRWAVHNSHVAVRRRAEDSMRRWAAGAASRRLRERMTDALGSMEGDLPSPTGRPYSTLRCAEWMRLMDQYAVAVAAYRRGCMDARNLTCSELPVMRERLDQLRNSCRDARIVLEDHRRRHGCSASQ
jgi:glycosyltransferase involved in cell wall biosynthesis